MIDRFHLTRYFDVIVTPRTPSPAQTQFILPRRRWALGPKSV
jgi:hypothetical protein